MTKSAIVSLGKDYLGGTLSKEFSSGGMNPDEALRVGFRDLLGLEENAKIVPAKIMRRHSAEIFEIIEEIIEVKINDDIQLFFEDFVEYRNLALGDTNRFLTPDNKYFRVATISSGNTNMRRQRLRQGEEFLVSLDEYGVAVYEEFALFMAGRISIADIADKVSISMTRFVKENVLNAIVKTFTATSAPSAYRVTVTGAPKERDILTMAKHIEAKTGEKVVIFGTALALNELDVKIPDDGSNAERNRLGHYGSIAGIPTEEIPAMHKTTAGGVASDEFVFDDKLILLIPQTREKFIKVVNEGVAFIKDGDSSGSARSDQQWENLFTQKFGIAIVGSSEYGAIKFS